MIIYVKQFEKIKFIYRIFNILKKEQIEDKTIIYIHINGNSRKKKVKREMEK